MKFSCSECGQHIACDESYSGGAIQCPNCGAGLTVPRQIEPVPRTQAGAAAEQRVSLFPKPEPVSAPARDRGGFRKILLVLVPLCLLVLALVVFRGMSGPSAPPPPPASLAADPGGDINLMNISVHSKFLARNVRTSQPISVYDSSITGNRSFPTTSIPPIADGLEIFIKEMKGLVAHAYLKEEELRYLRVPFDEAISIARGKGAAASMSDRARRKAIAQWLEQVPTRVKLLMELYTRNLSESERKLLRKIPREMRP